MTSMYVDDMLEEMGLEPMSMQQFLEQIACQKHR
jgi:hypothetical protein